MAPIIWSTNHFRIVLLSGYFVFKLLKSSTGFWINANAAAYLVYC